MQRCQISGRYSPLLAACSLLFGVQLLLLAVWSTYLYFRLTPVYKDIPCQLATATLDSFVAGIPFITPTTFKLRTQVKCKNPNPYSISIDTAAGGVFLGTGMTKVGTTLPTTGSDSYFPADGDGVVRSEMQVEISTATLSSLVSNSQQLLSADVPLFLELKQKLAVDISYIGGHFRVAQQSFNKDCGMMMVGLAGSVANLFGEHHPATGSLACADSWQELQVPPLSSGSSDGTLIFSAKDVAAKATAQGEWIKNIAFGLAMSFEYLLGMALLLLSARLFWKPAEGEKLEENTDSEIEPDLEQ